MLGTLLTNIEYTLITLISGGHARLEMRVVGLTAVSLTVCHANPRLFDIFIQNELVHVDFDSNPGFARGPHVGYIGSDAGGDRISLNSGAGLSDNCFLRPYRLFRCFNSLAGLCSDARSHNSSVIKLINTASTLALILCFITFQAVLIMNY